MTNEMVVRTAMAVAAARRGDEDAANAGALYLAFLLGSEVYAIEIERIREIVEYSRPTVVPMMPPAVRGVINLRGGVVPVIDLAVRFGAAPTVVGRRTCFVIVEVAHAGTVHVLGLVVDRVNAVTEIRPGDIEPPPAFGARINTEFIRGMARNHDGFVIVLDVARTLSMAEMAALGKVGNDSGALLAA